MYWYKDKFYFGLSEKDSKIIKFEFSFVYFKYHQTFEVSRKF